MKIEQLSLLATVVIAFAALAALVVTGQTGIRHDLRAVQTDLLAGQTDLREQMLAGQAELRREIRAVETTLRKEMQAMETALRREMQAMESTLRKEMQAMQSDLRAGQAQLQEELGAVGIRVAIAEHRSEALEVRFAIVEQRRVEWPAGAGTPAAGSDAPASSAGRHGPAHSP